MRLVVAALIWVVLVGGLATYMTYRNQGGAIHSQMAVQARGAFTVEVTPTFDLEPDPFALQTNDSGAAPALLLKINGTEVAKRTDRILRGIPLVFEQVPSLTLGANEVFLEANPPLEEANRAQAVRVRVLRDGQPITDKSLWSDMGSKISATFQVKIEPERGTEERSHGH